MLTRPLQATIELAALRHNLDIVRGCAPKSRVLAVIKAAAYGHGALRVARIYTTNPNGDELTPSRINTPCFNR